MSVLFVAAVIDAPSLAPPPAPRAQEARAPAAPLVEDLVPLPVAADVSLALSAGTASSELGDSEIAGAAAAAVGADSRIGAAPIESAPDEAGTPYSGDLFLHQAKAIPWRLGMATAAITLTGLANWNWGSSPFRFKSEGFFGKDTASLGMDKLGHAWSTYALTEFFTDGIDISGANRRHAPVTGAILAMGLMTYIEVFDGFSKDHGFSHEDLIVDAAGALFSVARRTIPGMRELVDFRLLYMPDKSALRSFNCLPRPFCAGEEGTNRSPITDYSNQRYLLAFKLSGIDGLKPSPLRFIELHTGYYARGFTAEDEAKDKPLRRRLFIGAGINLNELFFPRRPNRALGRGVKSVLEWVQVPYTAIHSN